MTDLLRDTLQASLGTGLTLKSELGGGGMSRVFVARDEALGRDVVVKVLAPELAEGLSAERFEREIRLAASLQEPHIVPVLTAGVTSLGVPYYTMPLVRGASLRKRLEQGPIAADEAIDLLRDVAQALAYAHAQHVVHRDIKPENILLSSGTAVVTDFGIAKALRASRTEDADASRRTGITRTGTSLGTPAYMAPEQAAADPETDQRADLYSWGVIAYEMLSGRHPFAGSTSPQQLLTAHMIEIPVPLSLPEHLSPTIAALVMQCLEKDPTDRPASATEVLQRLSGARARTTGVAGAQRSEGAAASPSHRRPAMVGAAVLLLASAGAWWRSSSPDVIDGRGVATAPGPVMMAVLPFEHAGPIDQLPFTEGLTDAVTAKLGALSSLLVIDRRSAATYRGTTKSAQQIGIELGVRYLLEGVVRWAKDGKGIWRARVTPTLVDAKSGAIKWTGKTADVTLDDPFTAQGSIATDVAQAMQVAILPSERVALTRRFTDNPQAYAAYQSGRRIFADGVAKGDGGEPRLRERALREIELAIALDSNFSAAWGMLVMHHVNLALGAPQDRVAEVRARRTLAAARSRAPMEPYTLLAGAKLSRYFDHDSAGARALVRQAVQAAPNDAEILSWAGSQSVAVDPDSALSLATRAVTLDPRSTLNLVFAAYIALRTHQLETSRAFADRLVALDSSAESGWRARISVAAMRGDTIALRRAHEQMFKHIREPSLEALTYVPYAGVALSRWFLDRPTGQLRLRTLHDSLWYFDNKVDAALVVGSARLATHFADTLLRIAKRGNAPGFDDLERDYMAYALALTGDTAAARREVDKLLLDARKLAGRQLPLDHVDPRSIAAIYAGIGDDTETASWIETAVKQTPYTIEWFMVDPRFRAFRLTPAWQTLWRTNRAHGAP